MASPDQLLHLTFDGREVTARAGQTVGAVLIDAGIRSWRTTRNHRRPRGLFCGIGICYDCLITVDGLANQRACLVRAANGMRLSSEQAPLPTPGASDDQ
jgi:predicted molibdopterin-dependent oxidoreductase YjgC